MSEDKTANPHRGEVEIELVTGEGVKKAFVMRPTFHAMVEIERATGIGLFALVQNVLAMQFGYSQAAAIVTAGLKAAGEPARHEKVGEMIFKTGLSELVDPISRFLTAALTGGAAPGEAEAADETTT